MQKYNTRHKTSIVYLILICNFLYETGEEPNLLCHTGISKDVKFPPREHAIKLIID